MIVFGVLRSSEWGWVQAKPDGPQLVGLSPVVWLLIAGLLVVYGFLRWEGRLAAAGKEPLLDPAMLRNRELSGGLSMFFAQFLVQAGVFFAVPLFLSVVLELSAWRREFASCRCRRRSSWRRSVFRSYGLPRTRDAWSESDCWSWSSAF